MLQMLGAVVAKLSVAQSTLLISSLLLVIARLVHLHLPELIHCLASMPSPAHGALPAPPECPAAHCPPACNGNPGN